MDIAQIATSVGIASSTALVISVLLLAYNLWATRRDARRNLAFSLMEQLPSKEFADRRWRMRESIRKAAASDWVGFDDSQDDFESRGFAYQYELFGQMISAGTLEYSLIMNFLHSPSSTIGMLSLRLSPGCWNDTPAAVVRGSDFAVSPTRLPPN